MADIEPSGDVPANVSGQGIQIGTGNNQYNAWMPKPPLDPAAMRDLNPHTAVARLQQLSHDELVDFFARAKPEDVSEILGVFIGVDLRKVVAALGDINRRKATELIRAVLGESTDNWLNALPEATHEIARKATSMRWTDSEPLKVYFGVYARKYKNGHVIYFSEYGAWTTVGAIDGYYEEMPIRVGFPVGDQEAASSSPFGTQGIRQKFYAGTVYSSKHGAFCVPENMRYEGEGGSGGWLGFPTGELEKKSTIEWLQHFEGGVIHSRFPLSDDLTVLTVRREVAGVLPDNQAWRPVSKETTTVSSCGTSGNVQRFEVELESGTTYEIAVYWHDLSKPVMVIMEFLDYYIELDAEKSWLGFPVTEVADAIFSRSGVHQRFEGGTIYVYGAGTFAVRKAVDDYIFQDGDLPPQLGFPVTEEESVGTGESDRIQFFENGVVTLRDGKYEIWLRPDEKAVEPDEPHMLVPTHAAPRVTTTPGLDIPERQPYVSRRSPED